MTTLSGIITPSNVVTASSTTTLTNKTLTAPVISTISNTGVLTLPTSTDTLVGKATTDTLTNKTLTTPIIASISNTGTLTLPTSTDTLVGRATTDTLTNKTLTAPTIASANLTTALTLAGAAGTNGQVLTSAGSGLPTWATVSAGFTLGTPVNSTSGTAIDFTGIPSGVRQIVISFIKVSTNGTSSKVIQVGPSSGIQTSLYVCNCSILTLSAVSSFQTSEGWTFGPGFDTDSVSGSLTLTLLNSSTNIWAGSGSFGNYPGTSSFVLSGSKTISGGVLDRIRITTSSGGDTFDDGSINIAYI